MLCLETGCSTARTHAMRVVRRIGMNFRAVNVCLWLWWLLWLLLLLSRSLVFFFFFFVLFFLWVCGSQQVLQITRRRRAGHPDVRS